MVPAARLRVMAACLPGAAKRPVLFLCLCKMLPLADSTRNQNVCHPEERAFRATKDLNCSVLP